MVCNCCDIPYANISNMNHWLNFKSHSFEPNLLKTVSKVWGTNWEVEACFHATVTIMFWKYESFPYNFCWKISNQNIAMDYRQVPLKPPQKRAKIELFWAFFTCFFRFPSADALIRTLRSWYCILRVIRCCWTHF